MLNEVLKIMKPMGVEGIFSGG